MTLGLLVVVLAVVCDAVAPSCLKASCGFIRPKAAAGAALGYLCIFCDGSGHSSAAVGGRLGALVRSGDGSGGRPGRDVWFGERLNRCQVCGLVLIGARIALAN